MSVLDSSLHPGDLGIPNGRVNFRELHSGDIGLPVVDDLGVELDFDNLTALEAKTVR